MTCGKSASFLHTEKNIANNKIDEYISIIILSNNLIKEIKLLEVLRQPYTLHFMFILPNDVKYLVTTFEKIP